VARRSRKSISEGLFARGLCLPSGTAMGEGDVERVGKIITRCRGEGRRRTEDGGRRAEDGGKEGKAERLTRCPMK
jgi:hypothetical protein